MRNTLVLMIYRVSAAGLETLLVMNADEVIVLAANGFVTLDISKDVVNVEYYARDMEFENGDLYPVDCDLRPSYSFQVTQKAS